VTGMMSDALAT